MMNRIKRAQRELESLNSDLKLSKNLVSKSSVGFILSALKGLEWQLTVERALNAGPGSDSDVGADDPDNLSDLHG